MSSTTLSPGQTPRRRRSGIGTLLLVSVGVLVALSVLLVQGLLSLPLDLQVGGDGVDAWLSWGHAGGPLHGVSGGVAAALGLAAGVLLLVLLPLALLGGLLSIGLVLALVVGLPLLLVLLVVALPLGLLLLPLLLLWWLLS